MSILVADDAPGVRKLLRMILGPDHVVVEAQDGDEALRMLAEHRPEIAILDVSMPGRSGIEVCRWLRQHPNLSTIGVIVITANGTPRDRLTALDAGADHFLSKPFSPAAITSLVEALLQAQTDRAATTTQG